MGKNYKNPPIKEAVIEIKFSDAFDLNKDEMVLLRENLKEKYLSSKPLLYTEIDIKSKNNNSDDEIKKAVKKGIHFSSDGGNYIIQIRNESLIFSRLTPYPSWDEFIKEFKNIFNIVKKVFKKRRIYRIGLRYINQYNCNINEIFEYIKIRVAFFKKKYSYNMNQTEQRFVLSIKDNIKANIYVRLLPIPKSKRLEITFDIDIFEILDFKINITKILNKLKDFREFKNDIFEANIGEKARSEFQ